MRYPHVMEAVTNTPWAIEPQWGRRMLAVLEQRLAGQKPSAEILAALGEMGSDRRSTVVNAVMVLPVYGILAQRMDAMMEMCGGTSVTRLMKDFDAAIANPDITAIVLEFDSPGGSVALIPEFAAKILAASGIKPIIAHVNTLCASAAYWLAAMCDEIVITPSGEAGSIGCFMLHLDQSAADAEEGLKFTLIKAGKYKGEGMPQFPLDPDTEAYLQSRVDEFYGKFTQAIAKGREVSVKDVRDGYGQGRTMGADQAVKEGLADRIASLDDVLAKLLTKGRKTTPSARAHADPTTVRAVAGEPTAVAVDVVDVEDMIGHEETLLARGRALTAEASAPRVMTLIEPSARGGAADSADSPPAPAPKAKEQKMDDEELTPAAGGGGAAVADPAKDPAKVALAAERTRTRGLNALGKEHKVDPAKVSAWIDEGVTVQGAKDELLQAHATATAKHVVRATADEPNEGKRPFSGLGDQLVAIQRAAIAMKEGRAVDPRLHHVNRAMQAALGGIESTPSDAGFVLQADIALALIDPLYEKGEIASRIRRVPFATGRNKIEILAADETSRVNGQRLGGVQMFWRGEGDSGIPKRPKMRLITMDAKKILGFAYASNESEDDVALLSAIYDPAFREELEFMIEDSVFRAKGAGQPLGFLSSDAVASQAIEATQTIANTSTFIALNCANMLARIPPRMQRRAVWFYTPSLLPKLVTATIGGTAAAPVFMPANGLAGSPANTILGLPAFASEYCEAEGTPGDLVLVVLDQYLWADKGGPKTSQSIHVQFLTDETAYKLTYRCDGQPIWRVPVTPYKGAATLSPFVTLAVRV